MCLQVCIRPVWCAVYHNGSKKLLEELENEEIPSHIREARFSELKKQKMQYHDMREKQHGIYTDLKEEKEFLELTTAEERCVIHFYHQDFRRCAIMDTHLKTLAEKYFETKFAKINVDNAKFFVNKLKIRILPNVVCFKDGIVCDRVVGFDDLGNTDGFLTELLEARLGQSGIIPYKGQEGIAQRKTVFGYADRSRVDSDSDDDDE